jgi:hypothetical protein
LIDLRAREDAISSFTRRASATTDLSEAAAGVSVFAWTDARSIAISDPRPLIAADSLTFARPFGRDVRRRSWIAVNRRLEILPERWIEFDAGDRECGQSDGCSDWYGCRDRRRRRDFSRLLRRGIAIAATATTLRTLTSRT